MITSLQLHNFKCFAHSPRFEFSRINLLTGLNGCGKSTVLQALLLLGQSVNRNAEMRNLYLSGDYLDLDLFSDLLHNPQDPTVHIELGTDRQEFKNVAFSYRLNSASPHTGSLSAYSINDSSFDKPGVTNDETSATTPSTLVSKLLNLRSFAPQLYSLHYAAAERVGPRKYEENVALVTCNPVGAHGEHVASLLSRDRTLLERLNGELKFIMGEGTFMVDGNLMSDSVLHLSLSCGMSGGRKVRVINCGFGYSYVLPVIVAALFKAPPIIIVENPEAHLHPAAQTQLMLFLIRRALETGTQLFVETHSEHIVNALRLYTIRSPGDRVDTKSTLFYFTGGCQVEGLSLLSNGNLDHWPDGFFDEQEKVASAILEHALQNEAADL